MSIKIGDVDLLEQGLSNEYRLEILERALDKIIAKNRITITKEDLEIIKKEALERLQKKYPNSGIVSKKENH